MDVIAPENLSELDKRYRATAIIYFAQIWTAAALIAASWFFIKDAENPVNPDFLTPLWTAIVFIAVGAFVLRRVFLKWERLRDVKLLKGVSGLLGKLQTNSIILGSMAEVIAILGVVITVQNGAKSDLLRAGLVSLIVFIINFPRKSVWRKIVANLEKV
ncbi:MAG TPA: hypothetical protein VNI84_12905 [Pyrinomonadaceae bacterium]|nr:hypothetical protein [Pyrinomonadaceae bacterium]